jgi:hypothetical protein
MTRRTSAPRSAALAALVLLSGCDSGNTNAKAEKTEVKDASAAMVAAPVTPTAVVDDKAAPAPTAVAADAGKTASAPATLATPAASDKRKPAPRTGAVDTTPAARPASPASDGAAPAATPPAGDGQTIAQKEGWANYAKELQRQLAKVNTACGTKISGSYDKSTYTDFDPMQDRTQSACEHAVGALSSICATDAGKQGVAKLTRTVCKFSKTGTGVAISGSTMTVKIDPANSSISGKAAGGYSWASAIKELL